MDAQQELFTEARAICVDLFGEEKTYDAFLPPEGVPYPFVYIADAVQYEDEVKSGSIGEAALSIHVYHSNPRERGRVSGWLMAIKERARRITTTTHYGWTYRPSESSETVLPDNTTKQPLLHGVLELRFKYSRR